jgi:hypothetical protein
MTTYSLADTKNQLTKLIDRALEVNEGEDR